MLQEAKEIHARTAKSWGIQQGHLYMRPYERTFDDSIGLVWTKPPPRPKRKKEKPRPMPNLNLIIRRRKSAWEPHEKEVEFSQFYA